MKSLCCTILSLFALLVAAAPQRTAVVDLEKVFKEDYKSKIAEGAIRQQAEIFRAYLLKLQDQIRQLETECNTARDKAQNLALEESARNAAAETLRTKTRELAAKRAEAEQYATERNRQMREFEQQKRQDIIADIRAEIRRRAMAEGYDFVLDLSGKTMNDVPTVLYCNPAVDLTEEVLKTLNATATTPAVPATPAESSTTGDSTVSEGKATGI